MSEPFTAFDAAQYPRNSGAFFKNVGKSLKYSNLHDFMSCRKRACGISRLTWAGKAYYIA